MAATYNSGTNTIEVTGTVDMEDVYSAAHGGNWYDSNADPVVESPVLGMYFLRANLNIGDGSTVTIMVSTNECVWFYGSNLYEVKANATLSIGPVGGSHGVNGSAWFLNGVLQNPVTYPHESDVRQGVRYGDNALRVGMLSQGGGMKREKADPMQEEDLIMSMIEMFLQDK